VNVALINREVEAGPISIHCRRGAISVLAGLLEGAWKYLLS
jgi:hypothetical protein